jgi:hypothetical protein
VCIHGHEVDRDASGHCKTCRNEYKKRYYRNRPEIRNEQRRKNRERVRRRAEIAAVKAILMAAHRLRAIGVSRK